MIYNDEFQMLWPVRPCKIENDKISWIEWLDGEYVPVTLYNPFKLHNQENEQCLYLRFAGINENKLEEILEFTSKFGLLGINSNLESLLIYERDEDKKEDVGVIRKEIARIRSIVLLRQEMSHNMPDKSKLIANINMLNDILIKDTRKSYKSIPFYTYPNRSIKNSINSQKTEDLLSIAKEIISEEITRQIANVVPLLKLSVLKDKFIGSWKVPNLLSAMYIMLYTDLIENKMLRKCRNETCGNFFKIYGNDDRKIYCNNSCARLQAQREYRRRKKQGGTTNGRQC